MRDEPTADASMAGDDPNETPAAFARRRLLEKHGLRVGAETAEYAAGCVSTGGRFAVIGGCARTGRAKRLTLGNAKVAADQQAAVG